MILFKKKFKEKDLNKYNRVVLVDQYFNVLILFVFNNTSIAKLFFTYPFKKSTKNMCDSIKLLHSKFRFIDINNQLKKVGMIFLDKLYSTEDLQEMIDLARKYEI